MGFLLASQTPYAIFLITSRFVSAASKPARAAHYCTRYLLLPYLTGIPVWGRRISSNKGSRQRVSYPAEKPLISYLLEASRLGVEKRLCRVLELKDFCYQSGGSVRKLASEKRSPDPMP